MISRRFCSCLFKSPITAIPQLLSSPQIQSARGVKVYARKVVYTLRKRKIKQNILNPELASKVPIRSEFLEWKFGAELYAFGKRINEEVDESLLRQAFTHRSYAVKEEKRLEELGLDPKTMDLKDNEYMATEGLNLLKSVLRQILKREFPKFPDQGIDALTDYLTSQAILAEISSGIGTKDLILCSDPPPSEEVLATTFLAFLTALYKSSNESRFRGFVEDFIVTYLAGKNVNEIWDIPSPWRMLVGIMNEKNEIIEPRLIWDSGKNTIVAAFVVGIYNSKKELIGIGGGETVDIAQEMSARDALAKIFETTQPTPGFKFLEDRQLRVTET